MSHVKGLVTEPAEVHVIGTPSLDAHAADPVQGPDIGEVDQGHVGHIAGRGGHGAGTGGHAAEVEDLVVRTGDPEVNHHCCQGT